MSTDQSVYLKLSLSMYRLLERFNEYAGGVQQEYDLAQSAFRTGVTLGSERGARTAQIPQEEMRHLQRWLNTVWQSETPWRSGEKRACEWLIEKLTPYFNPPKAVEEAPSPGIPYEDTYLLKPLSWAAYKLLDTYGGTLGIRFYGTGPKSVRVPKEELVRLLNWLSEIVRYGVRDEDGKRKAGATRVAGLLLKRLQLFPLSNPKPVLEKMPRPRAVQGQTIEMPTHSYGHLYFILNWVDGKPFEIFAYIGKNGSDQQATAEGVCRLASLAFRYGIDAMEVSNQLMGIQSSSPEWAKGEQIKSLEDAISKAIKQGLEEGDPTKS